MCLFKLHCWVKHRKQNSHLKSVRFSWTVSMCLFKSRFWANSRKQTSHLKSACFSWTVRMCLFKWYLRENSREQTSHLKSARFSCTVRMCLVNTSFLANIFSQTAHSCFFVHLVVVPLRKAWVGLTSAGGELRASTTLSWSQMSANGFWLSAEFSFGLSNSSETEMGWWDTVKVEEEQAAVSSLLSIRAMLWVLPVATSKGDPGNGSWNRELI